MKNDIIKKRIVVCSALLAMSLIGLLFFSKRNMLEVKSFSLDEEPYYLLMMEKFPSDKKLGPIATAEEARDSAVKEWVELFGDKVYGKEPYQVFFDADAGVWLVTGSLPKGYVGGVPYIIIRQSDGKILAVWHGQ